MGESTGKSQDYAETWEGGFIRHDSRGRKVYVIRRMINGRNYKVSPRATTLRAAMEQLNTRSPSTSTRRSRLNSSPTRATWTRTAPPG